MAVKAVKKAALVYGLRQGHAYLAVKAIGGRHYARYLHGLRSTGYLDEHITRIKAELSHNDGRRRQRRVAAEFAAHHLKVHRAAGVFGYFKKADLLGLGITLHEERGNTALIFSRHKAVYNESNIAGRIDFCVAYVHD